VLAEDLAIAVGCCAHLLALRRISAGPFSLEHAVTLHELEAMDDEQRDAQLLPVHSPLLEMPSLSIDADCARALGEGRVATAPAGAAGRYSCFDPHGGFLGVVRVDDGTMRAIRLVRRDG
jgi:tRNA pseudouridine55 synthase